MDVSDIDDYVPSEDSDDDISSPNFQFLPLTIECGMRYSLSNYQIANLINCYLIDQNDTSKFISFGKVAAMKVKLGQNLTENHLINNKNLLCIGFDGTFFTVNHVLLHVCV